MKLFCAGLCLLVISIPLVSSACIGGSCREVRDVDLEGEERVADRYLRRSNELLARFSKDLHYERNKKRSADTDSVGASIRSLEADYRTIQDTTDSYAKIQLQSDFDEEVAALCAELDIQGPPSSECETNEYRTNDGSCNNLVTGRAHWGKAPFPLKRKLEEKANYIDGISEFHGSTLPSAREVSSNVTGSDEIFNPISATQLVMHFAQFVDHDLVHIPTEEAECEKCTSSEICCPIDVPDGDSLFSGMDCLPFKRSRPTLSADCEVSVRHHENQITSYLDSSNVYGSTDEESDELRLMTGGLMNVDDEPINLDHLPVLPPDQTNTECTIGADLNLCGKGGDFRAAEQPGLTGIHTVFVREHNRIATELHELNPYWDDERLYQEARRIVNALYQHITYNELLPVLLGPEVMDTLDLTVADYQPYQGYDDTMDPTITTEFATSAFRMGHSFVPEILKRVDSQFDAYPEIPVRAAFFNATYVYDFDNGGVDAILLGMIDLELLQIDRHFSESITSFLFVDEMESFGMDLVSLNIQRGRDHGLPSYAHFYESCHDVDVHTFSDLNATSNDSVALLQGVYADVKDIDAFIGMVTEDPIPGAVMGPTAACVIGAQFKALKHGDRFWYENLSGGQAFTQAQLDEIRQASYARLLCDNLADVKKVQPYAFMMPRDTKGKSYHSFVEFSQTEKYPEGASGGLPGFHNDRATCSNKNAIPSIDLRKWKYH